MRINDNEIQQKAISHANLSQVFEVLDIIS